MIPRTYDIVVTPPKPDKCLGVRGHVVKDLPRAHSAVGE